MASVFTPFYFTLTIFLIWFDLNRKYIFNNSRFFKFLFIFNLLWGKGERAYLNQFKIIKFSVQNLHLWYWNGKHGEYKKLFIFLFLYNLKFFLPTPLSTFISEISTAQKKIVTDPVWSEKKNSIFCQYSVRL